MAVAKPSSLLRCGNSYCRKKFYSTGPCLACHNFQSRCWSSQNTILNMLGPDSFQNWGSVLRVSFSISFSVSSGLPFICSNIIGSLTRLGDFSPFSYFLLTRVFYIRFHLNTQLNTWRVALISTFKSS
jgi:hypothetical protein